jgi:hypothetical protein
MAVEALAMAGLLLFGYLAGLLSFKVKSRWCRICGVVKSCPSCGHWAASRQAPIDRGWERTKP